MHQPWQLMILALLRFVEIIVLHLLNEVFVIWRVWIYHCIIWYAGEGALPRLSHFFIVPGSYSLLDGILVKPLQIYVALYTIAVNHHFFIIVGLTLEMINFVEWLIVGLRKGDFAPYENLAGTMRYAALEGKIPILLPRAFQVRMWRERAHSIQRWFQMVRWYVKQSFEPFDMREEDDFDFDGFMTMVRVTRGEGGDFHLELPDPWNSRGSLVRLYLPDEF